MTPEHKSKNTEPKLTDEEEIKLVELEKTEKAARLGGGDVCNPFANEDKEKGLSIDDIAKAARNVF